MSISLLAIIQSLLIVNYNYKFNITVIICTLNDRHSVADFTFKNDFSHFNSQRFIGQSEDIFGWVTKCELQNTIQSIYNIENISPSTKTYPFTTSLCHFSGVDVQPIRNPAASKKASDFFLDNFKNLRLKKWLERIFYLRQPIFFSKH